MSMPTTFTRTAGAAETSRTVLLIRPELDRHIDLAMTQLRQHGCDVHLILEGPRQPPGPGTARRLALQTPDLWGAVVGPYPDPVEGIDRISGLRPHLTAVPLLLLTHPPASAELRSRAHQAGACACLEPQSTAAEWLRELHHAQPAHRPQLRTGGESTPLTYADLSIDGTAHRAFRGTTELVLTAREFALLKCLVINAARVCSRTMLLDNVWGWDFQGSPTTVDSCIRHLRIKVDTGREPLIHSVRGIGYVLRDQVM